MRPFFALLPLFCCISFFCTAQNEYKQFMRLSYAELDSLIDNYASKGNYKDGISYAKAAREKARTEFGGQDSVFAAYTQSLGLFQYAIGNYKEAEPLLTENVELQKKRLGEEHPDYAAALDNLGQLYHDMGDYSKAEFFSLKAINIWKKTTGEEDPNYAAALNNLAVLYRVMGNYAKAEPLYSQAITIWKKTLGETHPDCISALNNLSNFYANVGNYSKAEPLLLEVLAIRKKILGEEHPDYASTLNNLASLYGFLGHYAKAEPLYLQAVSIRKKVAGEAHPDYATALSNLAGLYRFVGSFAKAEPLYLETASIRKKALGETHPLYAAACNNLAFFYQAMGDYAKAESFYINAIDIWKKTIGEKHPEYAHGLNNLAALYMDIKDYAKAESLYLEALSIWKTNLGETHIEYANGLSNLAALYLRTGAYAKAEPLLEETAGILKRSVGEEHPQYASTLNGKGMLYQAMKNYDKAFSFYTEAVALHKKILGEAHPKYVSSLNRLADCHLAVGSYLPADSLYALIYSIKTKDISDHFVWLTERGRAAYWNKEKFFYMELNRFAALAADALPQAAALAYNGNLAAKSLLVESSRVLDEAARNSKDGTTKQIYTELKEKRRLIEQLSTTGTGKKEILTRYEVEADSLDRLLVQRLGEYAASKRRLQTDWKEVQAALKPNEAAIEFARWHDNKDSTFKYLALVLRPGYEYPKVVRLCAEKDLKEVPQGKGFAELHRLVWDPIDSLLQGVKTVYYSPDGYLNNLAFGAFCGKGKETQIIEKSKKRGVINSTPVTKITDCTFLSELYSLHSLSTTRYLAEGQLELLSEPNALILGGVNYDALPSADDTLQVRAEEWSWQESDYVAMRSSANRDRMDYLPGTLDELQNLQKTLKRQRWTVRAYSDQNASEHTVKAELEKQSPAILHIATHGFAFPEADANDQRAQAQNPLQRCGLLLAGANHSWTGNADTLLQKTGEDGILTALEVSNLSLKNTKLVVLSACETGLGKVDGTEGVFGLNRGFKLAGVPCIIVSLWAVPDKETGELMTAFYTELAKSQDPVQAFEQAQGYMRKKYKERPDLWAGFVLVR